MLEPAAPERPQSVHVLDRALLRAVGDFAKRLGQVAARSLESESSNILKKASANKRGLSLKLDGTLRKSHDMKVFGLGTLASLASR